MARRVGKIKDSTWLAIAGGAVVLYMITRPKLPVSPYPGYTPPYGTPGYGVPGYYGQPPGSNNTGEAITAVATGVASIVKSIWG